jgi:hypothetical protein
VKLSGDRCLCRACGEYFNSTYALDKHRIALRCRTIEEMRNIGMDKNRAGFWISSRMADSTKKPNLAENPKMAAKHSWRLTARSFAVQQHICRTCGLQRISLTPKDRFPRRKYKRNGVELGEGMPECEKAAEGSVRYPASAPGGQ